MVICCVLAYLVLFSFSALVNSCFETTSLADELHLKCAVSRLWLFSAIEIWTCWRELSEGLQR